MKDGYDHTTIDDKVTLLTRVQEDNDPLTSSGVNLERYAKKPTIAYMGVEFELQNAHNGMLAISSDKRLLSDYCFFVDSDENKDYAILNNVDGEGSQVKVKAASPITIRRKGFLGRKDIALKSGDVISLEHKDHIMVNGLRFEFYFQHPKATADDFYKSLGR